MNRDVEPVTIYIMARGSDKVNENIELDRRSTARLASVSDTCYGASFVWKITLPKAAWPQIRSIELKTPVRNANNRQVNIGGVINLFVDFGSHGKVIRYNVV